ncbi:MAG: peptidoglycan DD-metalloendopeptidase family protein [Alphaproteobacteria bacterium]|nr:peptidoglycan DD-metalloendopeptidase family protein [Alphaproteobacteria bacterium]
MASRAWRVGWAVACAAAVLTVPASAQTRRTAQQAERARAEAVAEARRARDAAEATQTELAALDEKIADAGVRAAQARAASLDGKAQRLALDLDRETLAAAQTRTRRAVEDLVIAAIFAERANRSPFSRGRESSRAEALARALGPTLAETARALSLASAETDLRAGHLDGAAAAVAEANLAIAAEEDALAALRLGAEQARDVQLAAAQDADRRARRLAAEVRTLRELAQTVRRRGGGRTQAATGALGALPLPVQEARLAVSFGQRTSAGHASEGLSLRTVESGPVTAPANATISYAGLFRSYGQILILDLDNGYVIVLAGMARTLVQTGERVQAGQVVGRMPDTSAPELYVEVRRNGSPIDPARQFTARLTRASLN